MDLELKDKVVFVAGGSRGIGLGIVEACLNEGAKVAFTARGPEALEDTRARLAVRFGEDHVWAQAGDMRQTADIEAALDGAEKALGPVWGAVANVGGYASPPGIQGRAEKLDAAFAPNPDSAFPPG